MIKFNTNYTDQTLSADELKKMLILPGAIDEYLAKQPATKDNSPKKVAIQLHPESSNWENPNSNHYVLAVVEATDPIRNQIKEDKYLHIAFEIERPNHLCLVVNAESGFTNHQEAYTHLSTYLKTNYGIATIAHEAVLQHKFLLKHDPAVEYRPYSIRFRKQCIRKISVVNRKPIPLAQQLAETHEKLKLRVSSNLIVPPVLLSRGEEKLLFPNTINMIQGKHGVHKSRLAAIIASVLLNSKATNYLGLKLQPFVQPITVIYIDSERNHEYQLPAAIQFIQRCAGYEETETLSNFYYNSLLDIDRKDRLQAIKTIIYERRLKTNDHLVILSDVITDAVSNFNNPEESSLLNDFLNVMINQYNATFFGIIHENPGSDKARGHLGSELQNKTSTQLQIRSAGSGAGNQLFEVTYLKTRDSERYPSFFVKFDQTLNTLCLANESEITLIEDSGKASSDTVWPHLYSLLIEKPLSRTELLKELEPLVDCSKRTLESSLKRIIEQPIMYTNQDGQQYYLKKSRTKEAVYSVLPYTKGFLDLAE